VSCTWVRWYICAAKVTQNKIYSSWRPLLLWDVVGLRHFRTVIIPANCPDTSGTNCQPVPQERRPPLHNVSLKSLKIAYELTDWGFTVLREDLKDKVNAYCNWTNVILFIYLFILNGQLHPSLFLSGSGHWGSKQIQFMIFWYFWSTRQRTKSDSWVVIETGLPPCTIYCSLDIFQNSD
jgi:hypothetical protein